MRLFALQRKFDEAWTDVDFERMMRRSIGGLHWDPPIFWRRSFGVDLPGPVVGFCVYETDSIKTIREHQNICWVPFTEAREVEEACGAASGHGRSEVPDGFSLFLVERTFERPCSLPGLTQANAAAQTDMAVWVRSFWDAERRTARCIFAACNAEAVGAAIKETPATEVAISPVLEEHPSAWAEVYDQAGVPKSWETDSAAAPKTGSAASV
ncbi:MAG: hypothetical protein ABI577_16040 [bacterium]